MGSAAGLLTVRRAFLAYALVTCAGCATTQAQQSALGDIRQALADTSEHARLAMTGANQLAREQAIARVLTLDKPALSEKDFVGAVSRDDISQWDSAFTLLDEYITALQYLTSPDRTAEFEDAAVGLGHQLATGGTNASVSPSVATGFTRLGEAIIEARANKEALEIMQATDGAFRQALDAMAQAIYDPQTGSGLRGTVSSNWNTAINGSDPGTPQSRWGQAIDDQADAASKRRIIDDYLQLLDSRDAQLAALDRLRQSLSLLADAHTSASRGQPADAASITAWINRQLEATRSVYGRFEDQAEGNGPAQPEDHQ